MSDFKYAVIKFGETTVMLEKKSAVTAVESLKKQATELAGALDRVLEKVKDDGFALQTPAGMKAVELGNLKQFIDWVTDKLGSDFDVKKQLGALPSPFRDLADAITTINVKVYTASLVYTGETSEPPKKIYAELVLGFTSFPTIKGFPLELVEIVVALNNFPAK